MIRVRALTRAPLDFARHVQRSCKRDIKMAAFSDPAYDFKGYLENRPRYPDLLYETVLDYHKGGRQTVLDVGTGPGLSLFPFAYHFENLIGIDPSKGMIDEAQGAWQAWKKVQPEPSRLKTKQVKFTTASAEMLEGIEDDSVDLITAATAAHWFDYDRIWPTLARVLRPHGTVAFWTYGENYLPAHPSLFDEMRRFMSSKDEHLGPYWPQPGRRILENLLLDVSFPNDPSHWDVQSAHRINHKMVRKGEPDLSWCRGEASEEKFRMEHLKSFEDLNGYFHTSSASSRFFKQHPHLQQEKPDMIDRHTNRLREQVLKERSKGIGTQEGLDDDHVRVAWPLGLMMIRKSA